NIKNIIEKNQSVFLLGSQGPDIFFYTDLRNNREKYYNYAELLHSEKTKKFMEESFEFLKNNTENDDDYEKMLAYLLGFLCHFALDSKVHPFIYYYSGVNDGKDEATKKYTYHHKRLEIILDAIMIERLQGKNAYSYRAYNLLNLNGEFPEVFENYYSYIMDKVYDEKMECEAIKKSFEGMVYYHKLLYDRWNIKKYLVKLIGIHKKDSPVVNYANSAFYPRKINDRDYLNESKNIWHHPVTNVDNNQSFVDLFYEAVDNSIKYIKKAENYLYKNGELDIIQNLSYSTGMDCDSINKLKYYKSIFD
ncbi:MAG: zinc dependent phospholipase C family protein, partial [Clostridiaceae bacterium]